MHHINENLQFELRWISSSEWSRRSGPRMGAMAGERGLINQPEHLRLAPNVPTRDNAGQVDRPGNIAMPTLLFHLDATIIAVALASQACGGLEALRLRRLDRLGDAEAHAYDAATRRLYEA